MLLSVKQAFEYLDGSIPLKTLYWLINQKKIPAIRPFGSRRILIDSNELDRMIEEAKQK